MKNILKIISFILVQTFLLSSFSFADVIGVSADEIDCLSPQIYISHADFQQIFLKDDIDKSLQLKTNRGYKGVVADSEYELDARLSAQVVYDEYIEGIITCLREGGTNNEIHKHCKGLYNILADYKDIKLNPSQLKVLIKLMGAIDNGWIDSEIHLTIAQALSNDIDLLTIFLSEMEKRLGIADEVHFSNVLFLLEQRNVSLNLSHAQAKTFIEIMKKSNMYETSITHVTFLAKALASKPSLAALIVNAVIETLDFDKSLEFYDVLLMAFEFSKQFAFKQKEVDSLVRTILSADNPAANIKGISILSKLLVNSKQTELTSQQIDSLLLIIKRVKISATTMKVFSEFFRVLILRNKIKLIELMRKVDSSIARAYYLLALKSISEKKPKLVPIELMEQVLDNFNLNVLGVFMSNRGTTPSLVSSYAQIVLNLTARINLKTPADFPKLKKDRKSREILIENLPFELIFKDADNPLVLGRTLVFKKGNDYYALKFMKDKETQGMLYYEHEVMDWVKAKKESQEIKLFNDYSEAVHIDGHRVLSIDTDQLPEEIREKLRTVAREDGKYKVSERKGKYTFMCYKVSKQGYFKYLNDPEIDKDKFTETSKNIMHDLAQFAKLGILNISLADLFHNSENARRYMWMIDILFPVSGSVFPASGAGRLNALSQSTQMPNLREDGLADLAELRTMDWIVRNNVIGDWPHYIRNKKLALTSVLGDYLLTWTLVYATRLKNKGLLDENSWKDEKFLEEMASEIKGVYEYTYESFFPEARYKENISRNIDWKMLSRQVAFFVGSGYRKYVSEGRMPINIFPAQASIAVENTISAFDGFGFVKISLFPKSVPENVRDYVANRYFKKDSFMRELLGVYKIRQDLAVESNIKNDNNIPQEYKDEIWQFIFKYRYGYRYNGIDEDLGPFNGPNPLTEMIKALYLFSSFMVFESSQNNVLSEVSTPDKMPAQEKEQIKTLLEQKYVALKQVKGENFIEIPYPDKLCPEARFSFLSRRFQILFGGDINISYKFLLNQVRDFSGDGIRISLKLAEIFIDNGGVEVEIKKVGQWRHIELSLVKPAARQSKLNLKLQAIEQSI